MGRYTLLDFEEGQRYMYNVWNFDFKPLHENNYFVEPWINQDLADCAQFRPATSKTDTFRILFFVKNKDLIDFLSGESGLLFMYGAYNQISVVQMRVQGCVRQVTDHHEVECIQRRMRTRIVQRKNIRGSRLSNSDAAIRHKILNVGTVFCFEPEAYAYSGYERG